MGPDVVEAAQCRRALGLVVDDGVGDVALEGETARHQVGPAVGVDGGQPGHRGRRRPLPEGFVGDGTHAGPSGHTSMSSRMGAWSDGTPCFPLRALRSMTPHVTCLANGSDSSMRSMRMPRPEWKSPAR